MSFSELFRTAIHSLRINPIRSMLAILGVIFGVGAVVVLISMGQGVKTQISDQIRGMGTDLVIVKSGKEVAPEDREVSAQAVAVTQVISSNLVEKDAKAVADRNDLVLGATGTIEQPGQIDSPKAMNVRIVGGDSNFPKVRQLSYSRRADGWTFESMNSARNECVVGDAVRTIVFEGMETSDVIGKTITIGNKVFMVKAVAAPKEKSLFSDPNRQVFIGIEDAREIFGAPNTDKVLEVYAKVRNASKVKEAKEEITRELEKAHRKGTFYVATQDDLVASYNKIFSILTALVLGVALVALAESAIGVSNIMYISVKERTREIGVRLAQGASFRAILTQFLFESITLCLIGAAIGIPLGCLIAYLINKYTVLPAQTPVWGIVVAFLSGMIVGVLAGVYPAWKATKSDIAEVLRAE